MTTLKHFTHQRHPLKEISEDFEFKCDGCEMLGIGQRYQCRECSFNLHMHCGHCPADLCSFMHPQHRLQLTLVQRSRASFSSKHACEVCGKGVGGLFYHCKRWEIYVHPLCSQLPQYVHYITDVEHSLELQQREQSNSCTVCGGCCSHWYYKCGKCPIILHIDCLLSSAKEKVNFLFLVITKEKVNRGMVVVRCSFCYGFTLTLPGNGTPISSRSQINVIAQKR